MTNYMNLLNVRKQSRSEDRCHISDSLRRDVSERFTAQTEDAEKKFTHLKNLWNPVFGIISQKSHQYDKRSYNLQ